MHLKTSGAAAAAFVMMSLACFARAETEAAAPTLSNNLLRLDFSAEDGRLSQIIDVQNARHLLEANSSCDLWTIDLLDGRVLTPGLATHFSWNVSADAPAELVLRWSRFALDEAPDLVIVARVQLSATEPEARWAISIEGKGQLVVRTTAYPRVGWLGAAADEWLAVPYWIGQLTKRARALVNDAGKAERLSWDYPGALSMQFIAYGRGDEGGLLASSDDDRLARKQFAVFGDGSERLGLEVAHEISLGGSSDRIELPYGVRILVFSGDWFNAAEHYRQWADHQPWVRQSRAKQGRTPQWVEDTGLWVWNRGRSRDALTPAIALQEYSKLPVSVFWHWWHGCAYDVGFPEYFPPREGEQEFRRAVAEAKSRGINAIIYMNQRLWGMTTESWRMQNAAQYAVKKPDGTIQPEIYNAFVRAPNASMCMGTPFWRNTYAGLAERALNDLGVSGIYMDQACSSLSCYDASHGHALGGGSYWMQGFQKLSEDIRSRANGECTLAGEGCGEGWLPYLDLMLSLQVSLERYHADDDWTPIPLFNAVYHDSAIQYGNYSSLTRPPYDELWPAKYAPDNPLALLDRKFSAQFRLEQARSFVWGQQLTIANFQPSQLDERKEEIDHIVRLAQLRSRALKYLRDGRFLKPPEVNLPEREIPMSRLSIYAGQLDAVKERPKLAPQALTSAWLAPDGAIAVVVVSLSDQELSVRFELQRPDYPIPTSGIVKRIDDPAVEQQRIEDGVWIIEAQLHPNDAQIYELVPQASSG